MFDTLERSLETETNQMVAAHTLRASVCLEGIGLHSGQTVKITMAPAPVGTGILFRRQDLLKSAGPAGQAADLERVSIKAVPSAVTATTLGTVIANRHGVSVSTIEHIMSAFAGCGVDHAIVEVEGPELPIMDGSAEPFVKMIDQVGLRALAEPRQALRITRPMRVSRGDSFIQALPLAPHDGRQACDIDVTVIYDDPAIGEQTLSLSSDVGDYRAAIAGARTFCYLQDVEAMRAQGLALGGSLDNAIVVSDGAVLNEGGLRFDTEFVRHKALDLVGDLYLLGRPLVGRLIAHKPGHGLNTEFAQTLLNAEAVEPVPLAVPSRLPEMAHA